ncbi:MAG TPA: magnesium-translocating P-type ATPase [Pyrinomonadaceae bacterium]|nr:magnesium-translocating P-type ATPase [Pyrinomonadaceae bacterium]
MNHAASVIRLASFWSLPAAELGALLETDLHGLTTNDVDSRLRHYGPNRLRAARKTDWLTLLLAQFKTPLILILLGASVVSFFLNEPIDASIIIAIVLLSGTLGFWQEKRAADAVKSLLAMVKTEANVIRDGVETAVNAEDVVPGDICILNAGDIIPGDAAILESKDLFIDEAALTGESFPAEKSPGILATQTPLTERTNSLFMGTHVVSGSARAVVVVTGVSTQFGKLSERLRLAPAETEFEHGVRRFGYLLTQVTLILVLVIFGITVYLDRPVVDSFLFALAIAVGIIPELLPAIISINLAVGAVHMAQRKVIVKQLSAIENLGSMNVLCADKTGTLTEGTVELQQVLDAEGNRSEKGFFYAYLNSFHETSFSNPIDEAIRKHAQLDVNEYTKVDEVPYDFERKRLSVLVAKDRSHLMITKGAVSNVLDVCSSIELPSGPCRASDVREKIEREVEVLSSKGFRTLGVAYRNLGNLTRIDKQSEAEMTFLALLVFYDPPKAGVVEAIEHLKSLGITLKVITGDNKHVATTVTRTVLGRDPQVFTGKQVVLLSDRALATRVNTVDVFAEIEPSQKERIIMAFRKAGNTVGFLGDGINDAPALHSADVGISVNSAVDVAKEAASVVLLEKDLSVLVAGVQEGRTTFANTLKYIYMTTSANFGNMFSMAGAALFLPFLPLLPKQILLNNFLTDFPAMAISTDRVEAEEIAKPRRWDVGVIRNFMIAFGLVSSIFDFLTFAALVWVVRATADTFRTGWFIESVMTEVFIILVMRTWKPLYKSLPSRPLMAGMIGVVLVTLALPYSPLSGPLGLTPLPFSTLLLLAVITLLYIAASELTKRVFYVRAIRASEPLLSTKFTAGARRQHTRKAAALEVQRFDDADVSEAAR